MLFIEHQARELTFRATYWGLNSEEKFDCELLVEEPSEEIFQFLARTDPKKTPQEIERECGRVLSKLMALMAAFFADTHYLMYNNQTPQLPTLLPQLLQGLEEVPVVQRLVRELLEGYMVTLNDLKLDRASLIPDLAFEMAESVAKIGPGYAHALLKLGLNTWLEVRTGSSEGNFNDRMKASLAVEDEDFLMRVKGIYQKLQDESAVKVIKQWEKDLAQEKEAQWRLEVERRLRGDDGPTLFDLIF